MLPEDNSNLEAAYQKAKQVFNKELTQTEAARQLCKNHCITTESTAKTMIDIYKKLMLGQEFQRGLSKPRIVYFLGRILADHGEDGLIKPISALWKHIEYHEQKKNVSRKAMREVALNFSGLVENSNLIEDFERKFQNKVSLSLSCNVTERRNRLTAARKSPNMRVVSVTIFERNPDVVAEVLLRASGFCEHCKLAAPFMRRKDNTPYLEVHHRKWLADGGEDTIDNAIALCPNCHRKMHFGNL